MSVLRSATAALLGGALLAPATPARACSVCACGDPLLSASDPAAISGRLRLQVDTEYLRVDAGTEGQPGSTDELTQWSYRLNVVYRPVEELSLMATLPVVSKEQRTVGGGADAMMSDLTGLGDAEIAARYTVWRSVNLGVGRAQELAVTAGTSAPTGGYDAKMSDGMLVDPHGQIGLGAWGPFVGASYLVDQGSWLAFASLSGRYRTEATYSDASRYQFGAALLWSAHGQYKVTRAVALDLGIDGRYAAADRATDSSGLVDSAVQNTGGTVLSVAPGVYVNAHGGAWLFVRAQLPFLKTLRGEQDVLPSFTTGIQLQLM